MERAINETVDIMTLSSRLEELLLGKREAFYHLEELPWLALPEGYSFKVTFPFAGAAARFRVCKTDKPDESISVYLDTKNVLGYFDGPYWEAYPIGDDVARFSMSDGAGLIEAITNQLSTRDGDNT